MSRSSWRPTRRAFMGTLAAAGAGLVLPRRAHAGPALFEEVPASQSGISFVHVNGMSPERYLPETMGPVSYTHLTLPTNREV